MASVTTTEDRIEIVKPYADAGLVSCGCLGIVMPCLFFVGLMALSNGYPGSLLGLVPLALMGLMWRWSKSYQRKAARECLYIADRREGVSRVERLKDGSLRTLQHLDAAEIDKVVLKRSVGRSSGRRTVHWLLNVVGKNGYVLLFPTESKREPIATWAGDIAELLNVDLDVRE